MVLYLLAPSVASAATRYVQKTGTNTGTCTLASPCLTINYALGQMSAGDTLVIGNGTYGETIGSGSIPNGSAGAYTVVKAENTGGVTLQGSGVTITGSYIQIEGLRVNGGNPVLFAYGANHVKFIRCAAYGATSSGNVTVIDATGASYILFEDCWAWGTGRYKIGAYDHSSNVIFRRCVARHDYHAYGDGGGATGGQSATFASYDSVNTQFQNVIAIDSSSSPQANGTLWGAFWLENNAGVNMTGKIKGSIILNVETSKGASIYDLKRYGDYEVSNTILWNTTAG